jgi:hypothetical protein
MMHASHGVAAGGLSLRSSQSEISRQIFADSVGKMALEFHAVRFDGKEEIQ